MSNRLIGETSPYLLQHADDPVDWYPWGEEAFEKARVEDKPVFLSIGYSACHWCHVMARESFRDETIAELLNADFVSVKVDREERPDVDNLYMTACQAMTGSGGWPLSLFLTPDKKPFFAGTYLPKTARYGMPGFCELLSAITAAWTNDRERLLRSADMLLKALVSTDAKMPAPNEDLLSRARAAFSNSFDAAYGGFGPAPKFPAPQNLLFLLQQYEKHGDTHALHMAAFTLERMAAGGIFDQIGGGFCRYSTDRRFLVPHFEKMLYDNALLILAYSKAYALTGTLSFLDTAEQTAAYLLCEMRSDDGGFYCAQDADSEGEEGRYYLFTPQEVETVLGKEAGAAFNAFYEITDAGNFEGKSIPNRLRHAKTGERFRADRQKLLAYRRERMQLRTDEKQLTYWNALAISGLCALYRVSGKEAYLRAAAETYGFLRKKLMRGEVLFTSAKDGKTGSRAFLDDHAGLALAALSLYDATLDPEYLKTTAFRAKTAIDLFFDHGEGGFFFSGRENETLPIRTKEVYDGALPCGNSVMTYVLTRLSVLAPDRVRDEVLRKEIGFMKRHAAAAPMGSGMFLLALSDAKEPPMKVVAVEAGEDAGTLPFAVPLGANVRMLDRETDDYPLKNGAKTYYVCRGFTCLPPENAWKREWTAKPEATR